MVLICIFLMIRDVEDIFFLSFFLIFIYLFIYLFNLAVPDLSCSTPDLCCGMWDRF